MLSLYYHELVGKIEEYEEKKYFMIDDNFLDKVLDKIEKIIDIKKFDDNYMLIEADDKLADDIALKNVMILIIHFKKDDDKFNPQIFLEEALYDE